jgi:two-component system cell cycle sensor histidine kinase/response regulator CckA
MGTFANAPVSLLRVDAKGEITAVNRRCRATFASHGGDWVGRALRDLVVAEDRATVEACLAAANTGNAESNDCQCRLLDNRALAMSISADDDGLLVAITNVSQAATQENTLRLFVEQTPMPVAMFDKEMRYLAASRCWTEDLRIPPHVVGRSHYEVFPEIPERWKAVHRRCLAGAVEGCEEEEFERADGSIDWVRWKIVPWHDDSGAIGGLILFTENITERKRLEERLRQGEKMEALGRLVGGVAHDFNNILCTIIGVGELAQDRTGHEPELHEDLAAILMAAYSAADLVRKLLAFTRKQVLQRSVRNLDATVAELLPMLKRAIGEQITITHELHADEAYVDVDEALISTVLMNLTANARDAMPRGGELTIVTRVRELSASDIRHEEQLHPGSYAELSVSDTGSGMDPTLLHRVGEPFFTTKERGRGTGLGLATVKGAVEQHGGVLRLTSTLGRGTTVTILLPGCDAPAIVAPLATDPRAVAAMPSGTPRTDASILLVEDEAELRHMFARALAEAGYAVHTAADASAALSLWSEIGPRVDLLVTDVVMPGMSGAQLYERLRRQRPTLPVLFMSGYDDQQLTATEVLERGTPVLQKPFSTAAMIDAIGPALAWVPTRERHHGGESQQNKLARPDPALK